MFCAGEEYSGNPVKFVVVQKQVVAQVVERPPPPQMSQTLERPPGGVSFSGLQEPCAAGSIVEVVVRGKLMHTFLVFFCYS